MIFSFHHKAPKKHFTFKVTKKGRPIEYHSLPTYIRNAIDHPSHGAKYTEAELRQSIDWMADFLKTKH